MTANHINSRKPNKLSLLMIPTVPLATLTLSDGKERSVVEGRVGIKKQT